MKTQIKRTFLNAQVERLNTITNSPLSPYAREGERNVAQVGNFHISGAYGGVALHRVENESGAGSDVFKSGHVTKRELSQRIDAYIAGIALAEGGAK